MGEIWLGDVKVAWLGKQRVRPDVQQCRELASAAMCLLGADCPMVAPCLPQPGTHLPHSLSLTPTATQDDVEAKVAISALKRKFMTHAEALLHGDLHTGGWPWLGSGHASRAYVLRWVADCPRCGR
jgi:hypothetical protein